MTATGDSPPRRAEGAFVVCSDRNWLWQSAFVLQQAIDSDPDGRLDYFYFTDFDAEDLPHAHLLDRRVTVVNVADDLARVAYSGGIHVPKATFLRFMALEQLSARYPSVIYADGDVFLSWGTWTDLLGLAGLSASVAAVASRSVWFNHARMRYDRRYRKALCPPMGDRYLNAGVLMVDSARFRADDVAQRALAFYHDNPALCRQGDQSALNAVLAGTWDQLSPSWNWQVSQANFPVLANLSPRVIHFTGPIKPWNDRNDFFGPARAAMLRFLAERGADDIIATITAACAPADTPTERRKLFQSRWLDDADAKFSRMHRYLGRTDFADTRSGLAPFGASPSAFGRKTEILVEAAN